MTKWNRRSRNCFVTLALTASAAAPGCSDRSNCQTFELQKLTWVADIVPPMTLGEFSQGTKVDVYPTYIVVRRPDTGLNTVVPMSIIRSIDVK